MQMSRIIAFVLCSYMLSSAVAAQSVLHSMWFSDSSADVRSTAQFSCAMASLALARNIPEARLKSYELNSKAFSVDEILSAIDNIPAKTEDSILFFYCGHGYINTRRQPFILPDGNREHPLLLKDILVHLKRKQVHRATALFDCCQTMRTDVAGAPGFEGSPSEASALAQSLFFGRESAVPYCVISSAPGELALGAHMVNGKFSKGALFSMAFADVVSTNSAQSLTWDQLVEKIQVEVTRGFSEVKQSGARLGNGETLVKQRTQTVTRYIPLEIHERRAP